MPRKSSITSDLDYATDPARFAADVRAVLANAPAVHEHGRSSLTSVRHATHHGHDITVRTTYEITVDGRPVGGHVFVSNSGSVGTHALPNYSFVSALDMVRELIDAFPENFPSRPSDDQHPDHDQGAEDDGDRPAEHPDGPGVADEIR